MRRGRKLCADIFLVGLFIDSLCDRRRRQLKHLQILCCLPVQILFLFIKTDIIIIRIQPVIGSCSGKPKILPNLKTAEQKTIFTPPQGTAYSKEIWAPEIHFINGKWYAYFAADDGNNNNHRMYVLENTSADPMQGEWIFKGKVADPSDKWAIDGDVFIHRQTIIHDLVRLGGR